MAQGRGKTFNRPITANYLGAEGEKVTIGTTEVFVEMIDGSGNILMASGTSVPSSLAGFAKPSLFRKTDAGSGTEGLYRNTGTTASCSFEALDTVIASEIVLTDGSSFDDSGGLEVIEFGVTASAVNEVKITNAATGSGPSILAQGGDAAVNLVLGGKGTGGIQLNGDDDLLDSNGLELLSFVATGSAVNEFTITNAATGNAPILSATGDDANVDVVLTPKGAGSVQVGGANGIISSVAGVFAGFRYNAATEVIAEGTGGAISVATYCTTVGADAGGDALTLAAGNVIGQLKRIYLVSTSGGTATVTGAFRGSNNTLTFTNAGEYAELMWDGTDWLDIEMASTGTPTQAPVLSEV